MQIKDFASLVKNKSSVPGHFTNSTKPKITRMCLKTSKY